MRPPSPEHSPPLPPGERSITGAFPGDGWTPFLQFTGTGGEYVGICLKNLVLILLTLGIYTPWAITNSRRYIWGNTIIFGDPLEYTGEGREILVGFLIIVVGLASLPLLVALLPQELLPLAAILYLFILTSLRFYFTYTALRYRLSRSLWRGIRGAVSGNPFSYVWNCYGWLFLTFCTGGLYSTFFRANRIKALAGNSWFGSRRFYFQGGGGALLGYIILAVVLGLVVLLGAGVFLQLAMQSLPHGLSEDARAIVLGLFGGFFALFVIVPVFVFYKYKIFKWFFANLLFGAMRFRSRLSSLPTITRIMGCTFLLIFTLGLAWPFIYMYIIRYWMHSIDYVGDPKLEKLMQSAEEAPKLGDGAFDALGLDFGI